MRQKIWLIILAFITLSSCGIYSFTGATIEGKNIHIHLLENKAQNVVPSLAATMTTKIRARILSQTGLSPVTSTDADYDITGAITGYTVTVSGAQNTQIATKNRLTISIFIIFIFIFFQMLK